MVAESRLGAAVEAFDRLAPAYDAAAGGDAFLRQRQRTHVALSRWLPDGCRVLEIGCGSGLDTECLAASGRDVTACDPSHEMQRLTTKRAAAAGVAARVRVLDCGLEALPEFLDTLDVSGFDAIVSNFGALNCVEDLSPLCAVARRHLRPGGAVVLCVMGRTCLIEIAYLVATGRLAMARRRRQPVVFVPVAGIEVPTYYHRLADVSAALGDDLVLKAVRGIGVLVPPPYLEPRWRGLPGPVRTALGAMDRVASVLPILNRCGDHVVGRWVKRRYAHA